MMSNRTIAVKSKDFKEVAQIIADNMLTTRHRAEPIYTKRRKIEYVHDLSPLGARCINLKGIYPDAKKGDCVYVATILETKKPVKAALKTTGCEKIFLDGQEYKIDGNGVVEFDIKEGQTLAEFYCECNETFEMSFVPSICYYPGMWARDYLVHIMTATTGSKVHQVAVDNMQLYRAMLEKVMPYFTGKTDEVPLEATSLVMPELTALAAKQSWLNNGAEVFITDIDRNISFDGTQFAIEYRRGRM